jgi:hypothetical protein
MSEIKFYISETSVNLFVDKIPVGVGIANYSITGIPWAFVESELQKKLNEASLGSSFLWTNGIVDVSVVGGSGVSKTYVDGSLGLRDSSISWLYNNTLNISSLQPYATNASIGLAGFVTGTPWTSQGYATVTNVNASLNAYATNSSVGTAIAPFATNASVGLAIAPFATNASVGLALQPYATNSSIGTAAFAKNSSIGGIAGKNFWTGTDASYTALGSWDSNTLYFTT